MQRVSYIRQHPDFPRAKPTTTKITIPSCGVGEGRAGSPGIWFLALRTGFWTCPSQKQQLSVTYNYSTHAPAHKDLSHLLEG